jgi:hypothetical protein
MYQVLRMNLFQKNEAQQNKQRQGYSTLTDPDLNHSVTQHTTTDFSPLDCFQLMFIYELHIILLNLVIEWLVHLLHTPDVCFKNSAWSPATLTEILSWFPLVIPGTGHEAKSFNAKSWFAILTSSSCLSA